MVAGTKPFGEVGDEQVTSRRLLDLLVRHWLLVAACALLGAVAAVGVSLLVPESYTVQTKLFLVSTGGNPEDRLQNGEYIRSRMASYPGIVTAPVVLDVVRENLGIPDGDERLVDEVSATNPLDTALIVITITDSSAERAEAVAAQIGPAADSVIAQLEGEAGGTPVRVAVVEPAVVPTQPASPSQKVYAAIGLVVGVLAGAGAGWLRDARPQRQDARTHGRRRSSNGRRNGVPIVAASGSWLTHADVGQARGADLR